VPVVPATVDALATDQLMVRWGKNAPLDDVEQFLIFLMESDGLGDALTTPSSLSLEAEVGDDYCLFTPGSDIWSMILAEEMAVRLVRCQGGEVLDGKDRVLAAVDSEESRPWAALESIGIMSLFRPRPKNVPDMNSHPLIPLEDCKITGISFTEDRECVVDVYFDYWARPCAFLVEEGQEPVLLYRPMYRHRQAIFGPSDICSVTIKAAPESRIYGALGVRGYKIATHKVDRRHTWSMKAQGTAFSLRTRTDEAWLTRSVPLWFRTDPLVLATPTDREFSADDLLDRKEQHWDIVDSVFGQEWYVAANSDGTLNPFGRIYTADPTAALLDLPGLKPKTT